jgi:signal transduction histidine kinase
VVSLAWSDGRLRVDVRDTGRGAAANGVAADSAIAGAGHGLVGMRERAAAVGGTLEVGPSRGGGFAVSAVLPTENGG